LRRQDNRNNRRGKSCCDKGAFIHSILRWVLGSHHWIRRIARKGYA
jgi:hypothetical protein